MRINKPEYYDSFACIGGECSFSCCQEWKIAVDEDTKDKWKQYSSNTSRGEVEGLDSLLYTEGDCDYIRLHSDGKCPFLNENGLCNVVLKYGEQGISKTCHTFPREMHCFDGMVEYTLAMGCPKALELLWQCESFEIISENNDLSVFNNEYFYYNRKECADIAVDDNLLLIRSGLIDLFGKNISIEKLFKCSFFILINCYEKSEEGLLEEKYIDELFSDGYVEQILAEIHKLPMQYEDSIAERNELFLDLSDNYRKKKIYSGDIEPAAKLAEYYEDKDDELAEDYGSFVKEKLADISKLLRILIQEELYSSLYTPESDVISVIAKFEWTSIIYAAIKHFMFLHWKKYGSLERGEILRIVAIVIRMTGYSDEDIEEYLDNSFEDLIWDWGYMALVMGEDRIE